jgi:phosphohistidine swiveling domain-containing protein
MKPRWTYFFGPEHVEGDPDRKDLLGSKGAGLTAMCKVGLPVPPGFTISTDCCRFFLEHHGQWPDGLEAEVREQLARLEQATGTTFGGQPPLLVAVRSGATAPLPGMMDAILNCGFAPAQAAATDANFWRIYAQFVQMFSRTVADIEPHEFETVRRTVISEQKASLRKGGGEPDPRLLAERYASLYALRTDLPFPATPWETLRQSIDAVFRSWNHARALAYRREHSLPGHEGTAVTVQVMFPSEVSGIIFTRNPHNLDTNELIIEASYGLGEAVVSSDVHPDHFTLDRQTLAIRQRVIGQKTHVIAPFRSRPANRDPNASALTDDQLRELGRLARIAETLFGQPMDVEFGLADGAFAILQARAIRGLDVREDVEIGRKEEIYRLRKLPRPGFWVAHSLGETLPAPTPLTWDIIRDFMSGQGGLGRMFRDLGYQPGAAVCRQGFIECIAGRIYADPVRAAQLFGDGSPYRYDQQAIAQNPKQLDAPPTLFDPALVNGRFLLAIPGLALHKLLRWSRNGSQRRHAVARFEQQILPPYLKWVAEARQQDLSRRSTPELLSMLQARIVRTLQQFGAESLKPGFFGSMADAALLNTLTQLLGRETGTQLALSLTQGLEGETTIEQWMALDDVAHGERTFEAFVERYGHRGVEEMELAKPRWREDDSYLKQIVTLYQSPTARRPAEQHRRNVTRRLAAEQALHETLRHAGGSSLYEEVRADLAEAQRLLPYREAGRHYLMLGYETIRQVINELASRWHIGRDIFFLTRQELATFEKRHTELLPIIAHRRLRWQSARRLEMPNAIDTRNLEELGLPQHYDNTRELSGQPVAAGVATGTARIIFDPHKLTHPTGDMVLVCPSIDPAWTALFAHAKALILARGSILSHGAIVARNFGIPAIVCADATRRIPDRSSVRVDGNRGRITFVEGL